MYPGLQSTKRMDILKLQIHESLYGGVLIQGVIDKAFMTFDTVKMADCPIFNCNCTNAAGNAMNLTKVGLIKINWTMFTLVGLKRVE